MKKYFLLALMLSACSTASSNSELYLARRNIAPPTPAAIPHCRGYGCQFVDKVELTEKDWNSIEKSFKKKSKNAQQERSKISQSVGIYETIMGEYTNTSGDIKKTFEKTGNHQLDCVDESTNTTIFLTILQEKGLLKFHKLEGPMMRVPFLDVAGWPHQTAVISETETGKFFAVDSWFHDNGAPAEIVPLKEWKSGWSPEETE